MVGVRLERGFGGFGKGKRGKSRFLQSSSFFPFLDLAHVGALLLVFSHCLFLRFVALFIQSFLILLVLSFPLR